MTSFAARATRCSPCGRDRERGSAWPTWRPTCRRGIEWVKKHAEEYQIDPAKLGLTGASAGGHLASLVAVTADDKTTVKAVGVFFPPTDFLEFRGKKIDFATASEGELDALRKFVWPQGGGPTSGAELEKKLTQISPARW